MSVHRFFRTLFTGLLLVCLLVGCSRPEAVSGIRSVDDVLNALENASTQSYENGLLGFSVEDGGETAKKCVKITYPSGGTTKYCGPNTDTIVANCGSRGWKCEETNSSLGGAVLNLATRDDLKGITCLRPAGENATTTLGSASVSTFGDIDCTFASQAGEDACGVLATKCGCTGCSTNDEGGGGGSVTCPNCPGTPDCLD